MSMSQLYRWDFKKMANVFYHIDHIIFGKHNLIEFGHIKFSETYFKMHTLTGLNDLCCWRF